MLRISTRQVVWLLLFTGVLVSLIYYFQPEIIFFYTLITLVLVAFFLWMGNAFITKKLDHWFPWNKYGKKRFFTHLLIGIVYSVGVINVAYFLVKSLLTDFLPTVAQLIVMNVYGAVVIIPIFSVYFSLHFLSHWQESELKMERFQKESMSSQLESLKNHLDPHFLFNNLNILSALIDKDPVQSQEFLGRFAQVYRTMLLTKAEDLITLREEMDFIHTYIYLIKTRFEDHIQFEIDLDEESYAYMLPPLTLQMLIENAVKHNSITASKPLVICINRKDKYLMVSNNLNEKPEELKTKTGTGLQNIRERYKYYSDEKVLLEKSNELFTAGLPLIEIETL